jgi:hypothetical protein
VRSEQPITPGKIRGFRTCDKLRYGGQEYFIKGRMSTGYAILLGIDGKKGDVRPIPKFEKIKRVSARSAWIISQRIMPSCSSFTTGRKGHFGAMAISAARLEMQAKKPSAVPCLTIIAVSVYDRMKLCIV